MVFSKSVLAIKNFFNIGKFKKLKTKFANNFDKTYFFVIALVIFLVLFGCVMIYSASSYSAQYHFGNPFFFVAKQLLGIVLGVGLMIFFSIIDYHKLDKFKYAFVAVTLILLLLVLVPGVGQEVYGAKRWINILGFSIQPSEIAKFAVVLFCAGYLSKKYDKIKSFKSLLPVIIIALLFCLLVMLEPSMSVTMCLLCVTFLMLFIGGISKKHTLMFSIPAAVALPLLVIAEPYRIKRLFAFVNPWASPQGEGFQLIQSLYSLGNGGLFGVGLFDSRQKYLFLPFAESDFIFSIIGEELGLVGAVFVVFLIALLVVVLLKIGKSAMDRFGCLLCCGVAFVIAVQTILNIAVVSGSIPPTGLPLPFISSGGTSVMMFMSGIGVCLSVYKHSIKKQI